MGIQIAPIEPAADGSAAVLIPATALIEADGSSYAFVEYENFYEPVPVTTGTSQGELIEITEGLSVGEQLVTQGGLSLYAQSRRAQPSEVASEGTSEGAEASTDEAASIASPIENNSTSETTESGFPLMPIAGVGVVALLAGGGALAVANNGKRR
jgi:cation efflux system membrane fusion protein